MNTSHKLYNDVELDTDVMTASSHRLVQLMFDKCLQHLECTKIFITNKDINNKYQSLQKSLDIVEYLRLCLNHEDEKTKNISGQLDSLYSYVQKTLIQANLTNDVSHLDEAISILKNVKSAWDEMSI